MNGDALGNDTPSGVVKPILSRHRPGEGMDRQDRGGAWSDSKSQFPPATRTLR